MVRGATFGFAIAVLVSRATALMEVAAFVPQDLVGRSVNAVGGWSLSQSSCPADAPQCGGSWCCPSSLTCVHTGGGDIGEVCCPGTTQCITAFQASPFCADNSWSLWNATTNTANDASYFCCLPGQVGLQTGDCVDAATVVAATLGAVLVHPGSTAVSSPSATAAASSSSSTATSAAATSASAKATSTTTSSKSATVAGTTTAMETTAGPTTTAAGTTTSVPKSGSGSAGFTGIHMASLGAAAFLAVLVTALF